MPTYCLVPSCSQLRLFAQCVITERPRLARSGRSRYPSWRSTDILWAGRCLSGPEAELEPGLCGRTEFVPAPSRLRVICRRELVSMPRTAARLERRRLCSAWSTQSKARHGGSSTAAFPRLKAEEILRHFRQVSSSSRRLISASMFCRLVDLMTPNLAAYHLKAFECCDFTLTRRSGTVIMQAG